MWNLQMISHLFNGNTKTQLFCTCTYHDYRCHQCSTICFVELYVHSEVCHIYITFVVCFFQHINMCFTYVISVYVLHMYGYIPVLYVWNTCITGVLYILQVYDLHRCVVYVKTPYMYYMCTLLHVLHVYLITQVIHM